MRLIPTSTNVLPRLYVLESEVSAVEDIEVADDSAEEAEYYTLQGVRVMNPGKGIYIRRQGTSSKKVLITE